MFCLFHRLFDRGDNGDGHTGHRVVTFCFGFVFPSFRVIYRHPYMVIFVHLPRLLSLCATYRHHEIFGIICTDVGKMTACRQIQPPSQNNNYHKVVIVFDCSSMHVLSNNLKFYKENMPSNILPPTSDILSVRCV